MIGIDAKVNWEAAKGIERDVLILLEKAAKDAETEMKLSITSGPKSGNTYVRKNVIHTASAPGQSPANDSGKLASSISYKQISDDEHEITIKSEYALALEVGTSRVAARPFIAPALQNAKKKLNAAFRALRKK